MDLTGWAVDRTAGVPKKARFTFGQRLDEKGNRPMTLSVLQDRCVLEHLAHGEQPDGRRPDVQAWAMREDIEVLMLREELLAGAWQAPGGPMVRERPYDLRGNAISAMETLGRLLGLLKP